MAASAVVIVFLAALISISAAVVIKVGDEVTLECPRLRSANSYSRSHRDSNPFSNVYSTSYRDAFTYFPVLKRERTDASDGRNDSIRISQPDLIADNGEAVYCGDPATAADCESLKDRVSAENVKIEAPKEPPSSGR